MIFQKIVRNIAVITALGAVAACGTPPSEYGDTDDAGGDMVAAEGAASADPTHRVRGATGLIDLGIGLL